MTMQDTYFIDLGPHDFLAASLPPFPACSQALCVYQFRHSGIGGIVPQVNKLTLLTGRAGLATNESVSI
jgi:hypothetical protein